MRHAPLHSSCGPLWAGGSRGPDDPEAELTVPEAVVALVVFAAVLAASEVAAHTLRRGWPTLEGMARALLTRPAGRIALLAGWLWLGWHLFVR